MIDREKIVISADIPMPPKRQSKPNSHNPRPFVYPVNQLQIGESFIVAAKPYCARSMAARWNRLFADRGLNFRFKVRVIEEGGQKVARCWRVE